MDPRPPTSMSGPSPRPPAQGTRPSGMPPGAQPMRPRPMQMNGPSASPARVPNTQSPRPPGGAVPSPRPPAGAAPNVRALGAVGATSSPRPPARSPVPGARPAQSSAAGLEGDVQKMHVANAAAAPAPPMGPAKSKRAARAYHQDTTAAPASTGWNDVVTRPPPSQASWQQEAAERADEYARARPEGTEGGVFSTAEDDAALDQVPGQRNSISTTQLAMNRAALKAASGTGAPGMPRAPVPPASAMPPGAPIAGMPQGGGAKPKIDPDQIPAPTDAQYADQNFYYHDYFGTCSREGLPLSTTNFAVLDQGNASPKFMRMTTYCVPATEEVAHTSRLPIAVTLQPFAQLRPDETQVPLAQTAESGPPRCKRCRAYINPWCVFVEGGMKWVCNLCGNASDVSPDYFCNLDVSGRRVDLETRPELTHGSIDFSVSREYWAVQAGAKNTNLLPGANVVPGATADIVTPSKMQDNVDRLAENLANAGDSDSASNTAAKAAKAAGEAALDTLNLGKGHTTVRAPRPMTYMFAIDVSFSAARCGALRTCAEAIREALYGPRESQGAATESPGFGLPPGSRVSIITFDQTLQFYNLDPSLDHAQMLVVPDIEDPFVPISDGLLVDPWSARHVIEPFLDGLAAQFADTNVSEAALGAALRGAQGALAMIGGQLNIFLSTIPTVGPGKLKHREDTKLYGTDNEKNLFNPQDNFYRALGEQFALSGIGVNAFFFPSQYIDVATIGSLVAETGGEVFFHPRFDPVRDGARVQAEVQRTILRETAYNVTMRVRSTKGLRIAKHYGNFHQTTATDLELGTWDADKALTVLLKHDGRLEESQEVYIQCAVLYTSATGERRVRCHTLAVPVTAALGNVFRYADLDSAMAFYAKEASTMAHSKSLKDVRSYLTSKCVSILLAYRRNCASSTSPGQLILPESFKLFPLYTLALMKNKALKGGNVTSDVRVFFFHLLSGLGVGSTMVLLYPRMMALHRLTPENGEPIQPASGLSPEKQVLEDALLKVTHLPHFMRPSFQRMEPHGAYLLENGEWCLLWLGAQVSPKLLEDLYGVTSLDELDARMTSLPKLPTKLSQQVRSLVQALAAQRCKPPLQVILARQNRDGMEVELANNLIEDQNNDAMSYVDYLCYVHRVLSSDMAKGHTEDKGATSLWKGFT